MLRASRNPSGNITGFASPDSALGGKWVDLLKEIAPRRMAPLFNPVTSSPLPFYGLPFRPPLHPLVSISALLRFARGRRSKV